MATLEFPHLMRLIEACQFDTVYHEHFSYLSLSRSSAIFAAAGLRVFDVEELPTPWREPARVYGCHADDPRAATPRVAACAAPRSSGAALRSRGYYAAFQARADRIKDDLVAVPDRAEARRQARRGLWRRGERQHAAQFRRRASRTCCPSSATPPRPSRASSCRAATFRSCRRSRSAPAAARLRADPAVEHAAEESRSSSSYVGTGEGRFVIAVPLPGGCMNLGIYYTKPSITELEVPYATDAAAQRLGRALLRVHRCFERPFRRTWASSTRSARRAAPARCIWAGRAGNRPGRRSDPRRHQLDRLRRPRHVSGRTAGVRRRAPRHVVPRPSTSRGRPSRRAPRRSWPSTCTATFAI